MILPGIEQNIKSKIERAGKPLKDWNISIYRGILTGYNEAFIINSETRSKLIAISPNSGEIIRPILRGRDIEKYKNNWQGLWLIFIPWHFPLHEDNSIQGNSDIAEQAFKQQYPAVYNHLFRYKEQLSIRNKAETGVRYEWYCLQRWGANYWEEFNKPKIIYPNMTKYLPFIYDRDGYFVNDKGFIITGENIAFLTAFLNSSLFKFCFRDNFPELQGGTRELRKVFFDKISVIEVTEQQNKFFEEKIFEIQKLKNKGKESKILEKEIDVLIFDLYNLNNEERNRIGFMEIE